MRSDYSGMKVFGMILLAIVCVIGITFLVRSSHDANIQKWAVDHGYTVVSIERVGVLDNDSPFWRTKGDDLCRVILLNEHGQRTSFFRKSLFGTTQAWKENE